MSSLDPQHGLTWVQKTFSIEPQWSLEPSIEAIKQTIQSIRPSSTVEVAPLTQGAFNKIYNVQVDDETLIMRISLPVDPHHKTASEVATLDWMHRTANIPVPEVVAHQSSRDSPVGFEWILMTKLSGSPLSETWMSLPLSAKSRLVKELAAYSSCIFRHQFRGIGNLYEKQSSTEESASTEKRPIAIGQMDAEESVLPEASISDQDNAPTRDQATFSLHPSPDAGNLAQVPLAVGRIVSMEFFWGSRIHQDIYRGPFRSSKEWITARLLLSENENRSILEKYPDLDGLDSDDEAEVDDATRTLQIIDKLKPLVALVFPTSDNEPEPSIIFHDDLSRHNILVGEEGELSGILDWECVSALPLWKACYYPFFLEEKPRHSKPDVGNYHHDANGEVSELYWEHMWEYEATILREMFLDEMKQTEPSWVEVFNKSQLQRDFDIAVRNCDNEFDARHIKRWVEDITSGKEVFPSLRERLDGS